MTENEAIRFMVLFREEWDKNSKTKNAESLDMAIEALKEIQKRKEREEKGKSMGVGLMKRLTRPGGDIEPGCNATDIYKRLSDYEDIGLLPEQIEADYVVDCNLIKAELEQYREIGTVEQCRTAAEKMKPKKVKYGVSGFTAICPTCNRFIGVSGFTVICPTCNRFIADDKSKVHCPCCGQAIDRRE